jgi:hypothetical protein
MAMYDDQKTYFDGLIKFIKDVDQGRLQSHPRDHRMK